MRDVIRTEWYCRKAPLYSFSSVIANVRQTAYYSDLNYTPLGSNTSNVLLQSETIELLYKYYLLEGIDTTGLMP